ncbi:Cell cycle regulated microtubule associated protein [Euphorbia peplus]|nr:Cell cycle regulated microtubule associated protein [Euphorbia peplus]
MDFEMEDFCFEPMPQGFDLDYEFDAPKYFDFTRPETDCDIDGAQCWFQTAASHSPSPMVSKPRTPMKLKRTISFSHPPVENTNRIRLNLRTSVDSVVTSSGSESYSQVKCLTKSLSLKHSNFMNPTASQLAKQNQISQVRCERLIRRCQKTVKAEEKSSQNQSGNGTQATKRQKLEAGYLSKVIRLLVSQLKHQNVFVHKAPKKVGDTDMQVENTKPKVTVAKEPNLETNYRAKKHRSKVNPESDDTKKSVSCTFRARPLNRKIFESPSLPLPKKSTPQPPAFQLFHLRTSERARQHASSNASNVSISSSISQNETTSSRRVNSVAALKEKLEALDRIKARCLNKKECNFPTEKSFPKEPPVDMFSKLSLTSEVHSTAKSRSKKAIYSKGLKENAPTSPQQENEIKHVPRSQWPNQFQCGGNQKMSFIVPKANRSLDIR